MRDRINAFDRRFADLGERRRDLIEEIDEELLYWRSDSQSLSMLPDSVGEFVLRSAAAVEQMIGGITTRLWDDPFEWTLPEQMPTRNDVLKYLDEVEVSRRRGFAYLKDDDELNKTLPSPVEFRTLDAIFTETLTKTERFLEQASKVYRAIAEQKVD